MTCSAQSPKHGPDKPPALRRQRSSSSIGTLPPLPSSPFNASAMDEPQLPGLSLDAATEPALSTSADAQLSPGPAMVKQPSTNESLPGAVE